MKRVRMTKDFDFSPKADNGHTTIAYKEGQEVGVTEEAAEAILAANAGEVIGDPSGAVKGTAKAKADDGATGKAASQ